MIDAFMSSEVSRRKNYFLELSVLSEIQILSLKENWSSQSIYKYFSSGCQHYIVTHFSGPRLSIFLQTPRDHMQNHSSKE